MSENNDVKKLSNSREEDILNKVVDKVTLEEALGAFGLEMEKYERDHLYDGKFSVNGRFLQKAFSTLNGKIEQRGQLTIKDVIEIADNYQDFLYSSEQKSIIGTYDHLSGASVVEKAFRDFALTVCKEAGCELLIHEVKDSAKDAFYNFDDNKNQNKNFESVNQVITNIRSRVSEAVNIKELEEIKRDIPKIIEEELGVNPLQLNDKAKENIKEATYTKLYEDMATQVDIDEIVTDAEKRMNQAIQNSYNAIGEELNGPVVHMAFLDAGFFDFANKIKDEQLQKEIYNVVSLSDNISPFKSIDQVKQVINDFDREYFSKNKSDLVLAKKALQLVHDTACDLCKVDKKISSFEIT